MYSLLLLLRTVTFRKGKRYIYENLAKPEKNSKKNTQKWNIINKK